MTTIELTVHERLEARREYDRERKRAFRAAHPHYNRWEMMKRRCLNPKHHAYGIYGARGIKIYSPWIHDFSLFNDWLNSALGPCPEGHSLDRIDNNGNYEPGNLRWADQKTQNENRGYEFNRYSLKVERTS